MPSIEIICVGQEHPSGFRDRPFAILAERRLDSHREPSLFQKCFDDLQGCIYHLGNPILKRQADGWFFAYALLNDKCRNQSRSQYLQFKAEFVPFIKFMIFELVRASPSKQLVFTSDWQFGPKRAKSFGPITTEQFWKLHDTFKLRLNSLYDVVEKLSAPPR
jgi:hypothetical protein